MQRRVHVYPGSAGQGLMHFLAYFLDGVNIDCGYLLEPPWRGSSNEYPQSMF